jgi:hypothetical protein
MIDLTRTIIHGAVLSLITSAFITITLYFVPRIWLQDYPQDIQDKVPPKTAQEKKLSLLLGIPFLILLFVVPFVSTLMLKRQSPDGLSFFHALINAFGIVFIFNLVDWLLLDWLIFCTITPQFVVIPGTEGAEGYKDYGFHFRGFLIGTVFSAIAGGVIGGLVLLL